MIFGYLYNEKKRGKKTNPKGNYDLPGPINNKSCLPMHRLVSPCPVRWAGFSMRIELVVSELLSSTPRPPRCTTIEHWGQVYLIPCSGI